MAHQAKPETIHLTHLLTPNNWKTATEMQLPLAVTLQLFPRVCIKFQYFMLYQNQHTV